MNKPLTEAQLATLRFNRITAELQMIQLEAKIDAAVSALLEARKNYANAAYLLTQHETQTSRQQTEATTESTNP